MHVALVAPHYFVGSFDDDASYILTARALLHGQGLTGHLVNGSSVVAAYPPGYPALIAPLVWIFPHTFTPLRLFSTLCFAAVFPLTWTYLRRRGVSPGLIGMALLALALSPPLATYGSMVMPETPFLVVFLVFLLLVDRWDRQEKDFTPTALGVFISGAVLVWLKEAAVGMIVGLVIWELWSRRGKPGWTGLRRAAGIIGSLVVLLLPIVIARVVSGVPIAGARYSQELGGYYQGGLLSRLVHVLPHSIWQVFSTAVAVTLVPYLSPLPTSGHIPDVWKVFSWHVIIFVTVGAVVWFRRHRDAAIAIVPIYLAETLLWPYVNERRVILVIPVIAIWYVMGAVAIWHALKKRIEDRRAEWVKRAQAASITIAVAAVGIPLVVQIPRDYLFNLGQSSSHFQGSRYMEVLSAFRPPSTVVETDYLYSTALFSGHLTARSAFDATATLCYGPTIETAIAQDHAGFLLLGDVNKPGIMDSPCLLGVADSSPWAVRLLQTSRDDASVYELVGAGTAHPSLSVLGAAATPVLSTSGGTTTVTLTWDTPSVVTQVSVGEASLSGAPTASSTLQILTPAGEWVTEAQSRGAVGDGAHAAPYLLAALPSGTVATAVRVVLSGPDPGAPAFVSDLHALGSSAGGGE
ncbi:MAG TPA: phospholipid carrier-dependent glycosyltransferase [Acidimicrobiales bacterium]|nr:phospholipid carrier-dependent glycosyltransferase [Acidimicrobiales bacterium]